MKNERPELKAGMIIKFVDDDRKALYINEEWVMSLSDDAYWSSLLVGAIECIYIVRNICGYKATTYRDCLNRLELIWSKKSKKDIKKSKKDIKIEEMEASYKELGEKIKALKEE